MSRSSAITIAATLAAAAVVGGYSLGYLHTAIPTPASTVASSFTGFNPSEIDLGERLWGQEIAFELTFLNGEAEPVVVSSVKSSCGCTILSGKDAFAGRQVAPGGSLTIPGKLTAPKDPGRRTSVVTLTLTSGVTHTSNVKVNVKGSWSLRPTVLDFGEVILDSSAGETPLSKTAVFESKTDSLIGVTVPVRWLDYRTAKGGTDATRILFRVLPQHIPPGLNTAKVVISTSSGLKPAGTIFVRVRGSHELTAIPQNVSLVGQESSRVRFVDRRGRPVRIATAESASKHVVIAVTQSGDLEIRSQAAEAPLDRIIVNVRTAVGVCAYFLAVQAATGSPIGEGGAVCFVPTPWTQGCSSCVGNSCAPCDSGTCPGTTKICWANYLDFTLQTNGFLTLQADTSSCFTLFSCVPKFSGNCGPSNPCTKGGNPQPSDDTFTFFKFSGDCPRVST